MTATGVDAGRPRLTSSLLISATAPMPMRTTTVPGPDARASQLDVDPGWEGSTCPETTARSWVTPRCVTGMPVSAGTATALVTPGTTSQGTPAAAQARASSP